MNDINIFALGGLDENGKNCYIFEWNSKIYVVNSGTKIPINSNNGIDTLIPNFSYLEKHKDRIEGIFITDVKNESFSALPWLLMKIPNLKIYTSSLNKILILDRLSKYKISNASNRIIVLDKTIKVGEIFVKPLDLAGSMPGHIGLDFITPDGDVVFMFNFVEGNLGVYGNLNFEQLGKNNFSKRKILALIVDSGRANYNGKAIDKIQLPQSIKEAFLAAKSDSRIIVGAYDEEMYALSQILELAIQTDRPIITYGKTYGQVLNIIKKAKPDLPMPKILDYKYSNKIKNAVILVTGATERLHARFLRITDNKDVYLKLSKTDTVLMIAPAINGLESLEAVALDEIARITPKIIDITATEFYRHRPAREDLIKLVNILKPTFIIPVQGLYRYLNEATRYISSECQVNPKNILLMQNGQVAHIKGNKLVSTKGKIKEVGDIIIDGFGVGDISSEVINEREVLGREGVILIAARYSPKTKLITGKIQINYVGVIDKEEKKQANELIKSLILNLIETDKFEGIKDLQNKIRQIVRKKIFKTYNKEPIVAVNFTQVQ
ncbi:hydrolase [Mycoplasmopsis maculosa]|uniref:Hydrolase n=1 Tax=Mycoplasmopsis maculosa TaxID=114885 RepID=A0A449B4S8_9BACT|nr:ribonuclease J [Mycoplasmopsis maculosa]VEU75576.1 hydrolase [Mycoplasmopsis maculosa]